MNKLFAKENIGYLLVVVALLIAAIIGLIFYFGSNKDDKKNIYEAVKVDGVIFDNITITENSGLYVLSSRVRNETKKDVELKNIEITLYDEKNEETNLKGYVGEVKAGKESKLVVNIDQDITKTKKIKIDVKK